MNLHSLRRRAHHGGIVLEVPSEPDEATLRKATESIKRRVPRDAPALVANPRKPLSPALQRVVELGRDTSIYLGGDVFAMESAHNCSLGEYITGVGRMPVDEDGQMKGLGEAFWDNDEYKFESYFLTRVLCGDLRRVDNPEEADLCYPVCGGPEAYAAEKQRRSNIRRKHGFAIKLGGFDIENIGLIFEVPDVSKSKWSGCERIGLFYETEQREDDHALGFWKQCKVMVPFLHGSAAMTPEAAMPYDKRFNKTTLLTYVGGTWHGRVRGELLQELKVFSRKNGANDTHRWFSMPIQYPHNVGKFWHIPEMHTLVREQYAAAEFSWQPFGDTATRRGFYDAWMLGAIPIVSPSSATYYRRLFNRAVFQHLSDYIFVASSKVLDDGQSFMEWVMAKDPIKIQTKRENMRQLAPFMQYGWESEADALTAAFGVLKMAAIEQQRIQGNIPGSEADGTNLTFPDMDGLHIDGYTSAWAPVRELHKLSRDSRRNAATGAARFHSMARSF